MIIIGLLLRTGLSLTVSTVIATTFPPRHRYTLSHITVAATQRVPSIDNKSSLYVRDPVDLFIAECHLACLRPISVLRSIPQTGGKGLKKQIIN